MSIFKKTGTARVPLFAGFLSFVVPGLGQLYNGQATRGLLWFCISSLWGSIVFLLGLNAMKQNFPAFGLTFLFFSLLISFGFWVFVVFDAIRQSKIVASPYTLKKYNRWYIYLLIVVIVSGIDYATEQQIKALLVKAYRIPTRSMSPTLMPGDFLLSNKLQFCCGNPNRGEIVIFTNPQKRDVEFIKRVIGLPGDKIEIRDNQVFINAAQLEESYLVPEKIKLPSRGDYGPFVVPHNQYFVLGDNRNNSLDSRDFGAIDRSSIKGKPIIIYFSISKKFPFIRFERIGKKIQ